MESDTIRSFFDEPIRQALLLYYELIRGIRGAMLDPYEQDKVMPKKIFTNEDIKKYLESLSLGELLALCQRCKTVRTEFGKSVELIIEKYKKERTRMTGLYVMSMLIIAVFGCAYGYMNGNSKNPVWGFIPFNSPHVLAFLIGLFGLFVIIAHRLTEIYTKDDKSNFKIEINIWKDFGPYWIGSKDDDNSGWVQAFTGQNNKVLEGPINTINDKIGGVGASAMVKNNTTYNIDSGTLDAIAGQIKTYIDRYNSYFITPGISASGVNDAYTRDRVVLEDFFRKTDFWMNKQYQSTIHARDDKTAARELYSYVMWYDAGAAAKDDDVCNSDLAPTEPRRRCSLSESTKLMNLRRRILTDILRPATINEIKTDTDTYAYGLVKRIAEILFTRQHLINGKMEGIAKWMNPLIQRDPAAPPGAKSRVYNNWLTLLRTIHRDFVIAKAMDTDIGDMEPRGGYVQHSTFKRMLRSMDTAEIKAKVSEMRDYIGIANRLQQRVQSDKTIQEKAALWNLNQQCMWIAYGFGGTSAGISLSYYIYNLYAYQEEKRKADIKKEIEEAKKEATRPAAVARMSALGLPGTTVQAMTQAVTANTAAALVSIRPILNMDLKEYPEVKEKRDDLTSMMAVMSALQARMKWAEVNLTPDGPTKESRMKQLDTEVTRELAKVQDTSAYASYKEDIKTKDDPMVLRDMYNGLAQDYNRVQDEIQSMVRYYGLDTKKAEEKKDDEDFKHVKDERVKDMLKLLDPILKFRDVDPRELDLNMMIDLAKQEKLRVIMNGIFRLVSFYKDVGDNADIELKKEKTQLGLYKSRIELAYKNVVDANIDKLTVEGVVATTAESLKKELKEHVGKVKEELNKKNDSGSSSGNQRSGRNGQKRQYPSIKNKNNGDIKKAYELVLRIKRSNNSGYTLPTDKNKLLRVLKEVQNSAAERDKPILEKMGDLDSVNVFNDGSKITLED